jgi:hypothetical protein
MCASDGKFCTLQPKAKQNADVQAWADAYGFIYAYPESFQIELALRTLRVEFRSAREPRRAGAFAERDRDAYFAELRTFKGVPLQDEVKAFAAGTA